MKLEEIKEEQYLYYTERGCAPFRGSSPDHADSLFRIYRSGETLRAQRLCHNWDGNYKNIEGWDPFYDAIFVASGFDERRWFLTDFPGGDAAEWMNRNYPLNGQAVKEEPCRLKLELDPDPKKYVTGLIEPASQKKPHYLSRSLDGKLIMRRDEAGGFVLLAHNQETLVEIPAGDARDFALWILLHQD